MSGAHLLQPSCNEKTVCDGRGGIFTFLPEEPLVEINLIVIKANSNRGAHYHKDFKEYFMVISGKGLYVTRGEHGERIQYLVSGGEMIVLPTYTPHIVYAIEDMTCVAMLTSRWDDSAEPITVCPAEQI